MQSSLSAARVQCADLEAKLTDAIEVHDRLAAWLTVVDRCQPTERADRAAKLQHQAGGRARAPSSRPDREVAPFWSHVQESKTLFVQQKMELQSQLSTVKVPREESQRPG